MPLGVSINRDKTRIVNTLNKESFGFLGFDFRRVPKKRSHGVFHSHDSEKESP
jgi:RNA-directed DNA polymerase